MAKKKIERNIGQQKCRSCNETKDNTEFYTTETGHKLSICKECYDRKLEQEVDSDFLDLTGNAIYC